MSSVALCLEALSALTGCSVEPTAAASQLSAQDIVNIAVLKQFFKQEGLQELNYPSLGSLSLRGNDEDVEDLYSSPPALLEGPCPEPRARPSVKINPDTFFDHKFDYDFTNINVRPRQDVYMIIIIIIIMIINNIMIIIIIAL